MEEVRRRTFLALAATSAGLTTGYTFMNQNTSTPEPRSDSRGTVVTTLRELEAAFDDLSPNESIHVSDENAPYRTTEWLDIDVDGVTVTGPGVRTLVKPADGADVGGFRIGHGSRCRDVDIRGVGYHGNPDGQSDAADRLHGIAVRNATNVTLERNQIRRTHPQRHGDGGSAISVTRKSSDVRIRNNRIRRFGDRGVQLGGTRLTVSGNVITRGLDRPIACDLWYPDQKNRTAQNVSIFGNLLGNSVEGSLVGVARNTPLSSNEGYVSIFGNVGFGSHKSFCHIRGPNAIRNVSVQNNVSVQETDLLHTEETTKFAGISVDVETGRNLSIRNNGLFDYSGHGVHVNSSVTGLSLQHNDITEAGLSGIRLVGDIDGLVDGNHVMQPAGAGIRLEGTSGVAVRGNYVRRAGTAGVVTEGSDTGTSNDIAANSVVANGQRSNQSVPAIVVRDFGVRVKGNTIQRHDASAIAEGDDAGNNVYEGNLADGERPWQITSPTSRVRNHTPPVGVHRDVTTGSESNVTYVQFDRPYAKPPRLSFGRVGSGIRERTYETDENGNYEGVRIITRRPGTTLDVFVEQI